jgi:hypothetical protein
MVSLVFQARFLPGTSVAVGLFLGSTVMRDAIRSCEQRAKVPPRERGKIHMWFANVCHGQHSAKLLGYMIYDDISYIYVYTIVHLYSCITPGIPPCETKHECSTQFIGLQQTDQCRKPQYQAAHKHQSILPVSPGTHREATVLPGESKTQSYCI